ncbi:hypothetical protein D9M71_570170 [compost metagenome]
MATLLQDRAHQPVFRWHRQQPQQRPVPVQPQTSDQRRPFVSRQHWRRPCRWYRPRFQYRPGSDRCARHRKRPVFQVLHARRRHAVHRSRRPGLQPARPGWRPPWRGAHQLGADDDPRRLAPYAGSAAAGQHQFAGGGPGHGQPAGAGVGDRFRQPPS